MLKGINCLGKSWRYYSSHSWHSRLRL